MRKRPRISSLELAADSGRLPASSSIRYHFFVGVSQHETEAPVIHSLRSKRSESLIIQQEGLILFAI